MSAFASLLFDLDDTLYPEAEFVESGHRAVAGEIARIAGLSFDDVFEQLRYDHLKLGRTGAIDRAADRHGLPEGRARDLVAVYREHQPVLRLAPEVAAMLGRLGRSYRLAIVTDGADRVQKRKVEALGIARLVDTVVYCWEIQRAKPDPGGYQEAVRRLGVGNGPALIVGDDPLHDVAAARAAGMACVRIRAHRFADLVTRSAPTVGYREVASVLDLEGLLADWDWSAS